MIYDKYKDEFSVFDTDFLILIYERKWREREREREIVELVSRT